MAINWDLYNKKLIINGETKRERNLNCLKNNINKYLPDSLSYKNVKISDIDRHLEFVKTKNDVVEINSMPDENFNCGEYVKYKDRTYLIIQAKIDDDTHVYGKMQECNYNLKWQTKNLDIIEMPCIISDATLYSNGENKNKQIVLGDNQLLVMIQFNEKTIELRRGKRFFVDNYIKDATPYKLTKIMNMVNVINGKGYISLIVTEDQINIDKDNKELMVCDYILPSPTPPIGIIHSEIFAKYYTLKVGSFSGSRFTAIFKNEQGEVIEGIIPQWNIVSEYNIEKKVDSNSIILKLDNDKAIGSSFKLQIINDGYFSEKEIKITGLF